VVIPAGWAKTVFDLAWVGWLCYWLGEPLYERARGRAKAVARRGRGALVSLLLLIGAFGVLQISFTGPLGFLGPGRSPSSPPILLLGLLLGFAGLSFSIWARAFLGSNWSATPVLKQGQELVTTGPYAVVRNPIYLGLTIAIVGTGLVFGGYRILLSVACMLLFSWVRIREEERLMSEQFGEVFEAYKGRVRAFLPGLL
jgi:protein-S-isoprenylcysteine O-methyltransferase Ste14